jgi:hypothetical protein
MAVVAKFKNKFFNDAGVKKPMYIGSDGRAMERKEQARRFDTEESGLDFIRNTSGSFEGKVPEIEFEPS